MHFFKRIIELLLIFSNENEMEYMGGTGKHGTGTAVMDGQVIRWVKK